MTHCNTSSRSPGNGSFPSHCPLGCGFPYMPDIPAEVTFSDGSVREVTVKHSDSFEDLRAQFGKEVVDFRPVTGGLG